jgi:RNA polymerase primary sigma factor
MEVYYTQDLSKLYHISGGYAMPFLTDLSNEQIVEQINKNINVVANYELLYTRNLNYIKKILKPISDASGEPLEDLLQESYFAIQTAVSHYESSENVPFINYASYWIRQRAYNYVRTCGLLKVPAGVHDSVLKYKKTVSDHERDFGVSPDFGNMSKILNIDKHYLDKIKVLASGVSSLDLPLTDTDDSFTMGDTLASDISVEDSAIDSYMDEQRKTELWAIVERTVNERENAVIRDFFIRGDSLASIGKKYGITMQRASQIKLDGLNRLRRGKARRELEQRFEELDSRMYRNHLATFQRTFTSQVERLALERISAQERYKATTDLISQLDREDMQARKRELDAEYERLLQEMNA